MISIIRENKRKILNNPNFWAIIVVTITLILIYSLWPWREWSSTNSVWSWFSWLSPLSNLALLEFGHHIIGVLFLIPILYASIAFSWPGAICISALSLGGLLSVTSGISLAYFPFTNITVLLIPCLVTSIISLELKWHRKNSQIFAERERERKIYVSNLLEAQENERKRIAQEIHDEIIQTLLIIGNHAQNILPSKQNVDEVEKNVEYIKDAILKAVEEFRRISRDLRPSILDDMGLIPALKWLTSRTSADNAIHASLIVNGIERKLSPQIEINAFRIVQESLNNISRHAKAKEAIVTLEFTSENFKLEIQDDGQGFHPPKGLSQFAAVGKLGLFGIQQRVGLLGGTLSICSKPGEGTIILVQANY